MAGAIAMLLQRAKLAAAPQRQATEVVPSSPVLTAPASPNVFTYPAGYKMEGSDMLNANRPVMDAAPTVSVPSPSVPALQSASTVHPTVSFDWKKYLPWILIVLAVFVLLLSMKKKGG